MLLSAYSRHHRIRFCITTARLRPYAILESRNLRFTDINMLNDSQEMRCGAGSSSDASALAETYRAEVDSVLNTMEDELINATHSNFFDFDRATK
jgi:hypothetical protein